jgi:hypothetical protein
MVVGEGEDVLRTGSRVQEVPGRPGRQPPSTRGYSTVAAEALI